MVLVAWIRGSVYWFPAIWVVRRGRRGEVRWFPPFPFSVLHATPSLQLQLQLYCLFIYLSAFYSITSHPFFTTYHQSISLLSTLFFYSLFLFGGLSFDFASSRSPLPVSLIHSNSLSCSILCSLWFRLSCIWRLISSCPPFLLNLAYNSMKLSVHFLNRAANRIVNCWWHFDSNYILFYNHFNFTFIMCTSTLFSIGMRNKLNIHYFSLHREKGHNQALVILSPPFTGASWLLSSYFFMLLSYSNWLSFWYFKRIYRKKNQNITF